MTEEGRYNIIHSQRALQAADMALALWTTSIRALNRLTRAPWFHLFKKIAKEILPIKAIADISTACTQFLTTYTLNKKKPHLQPLKTSAAVSTIVLVVIGVAIPPLAAAMMTARFAISTVKNIAHAFVNVKKIFNNKKIVGALGNTDPQKTCALIAENKSLQKRIVRKTGNALLALSTLIGCALLFTPLAPIGLGILAGTMFAKCSWATVKFSWKRSDQKKALLTEKKASASLTPAPVENDKKYQSTANMKQSLGKNKSTGVPTKKMVIDATNDENSPALANTQKESQNTIHFHYRLQKAKSQNKKILKI